MMDTVGFENGEFSVDAALIAEGLGLDPAIVLNGMREQSITSLCERGDGEDAGRYRLTFFHAQRRFRLVVDESGTILDRSIEDVPLRKQLRHYGRRRATQRF